MGIVHIRMGIQMLFVLSEVMIRTPIVYAVGLLPAPFAYTQDTIYLPEA